MAHRVPGALLESKHRITEHLQRHMFTMQLTQLLELNDCLYKVFCAYGSMNMAMVVGYNPFKYILKCDCSSC